jgi:hypothetical protein
MSKFNIDTYIFPAEIQIPPKTCRDVAGKGMAGMTWFLKADI